MSDTQRDAQEDLVEWVERFLVEVPTTAGWEDSYRAEVYRDPVGAAAEMLCAHVSGTWTLS